MGGAAGVVLHDAAIPDALAQFGHGVGRPGHAAHEGQVERALWGRRAKPSPSEATERNTPLRHFLYFCGKDKDYYETQSI